MFFFEAALGKLDEERDRGQKLLCWASAAVHKSWTMWARAIRELYIAVRAVAQIWWVERDQGSMYCRIEDAKRNFDEEGGAAWLKDRMPRC